MTKKTHMLKKDTLVGLILPILLVLYWEFAVQTGFFPKSLIASPSIVASKFIKLLLDFTLVEHALVSLKRLFLGFGIGILLGISFGVIVGALKTGARIFEPLFLILIPVPPMAWIPILIIFLGIDEASKVAIIAIGGFATLFLETSLGIRSINKEYIELASIYKKNWKTVLTKILIPATLPKLLSSMRVAMALSWTLLMASEIIASSKGIGWLIWDSRNFSRPDDMLVGMIAVGLMGKLTDYLIVRTEKYFTRWRTSLRDI